ncbi:trypsin-like peptidase domain-containing protein [Pseudonocardia kujensis]|uniref:trypsin-like peptidase domain-containing protein n=1 Tax=Pseudonocardia kujensis TaxID=1128675 RepID=UPI001E4515FB|nr:trypsin-like peptidase domain-containing protein [Pseudonocardia kujensis]MCE0765643.1 trypsin-like peptidase domain-containing protein [Pseudonocardia kujensis]
MTGTIARAAAAVAVAASVTLATAGTALAAEPGAPPGPGTSPPQATPTEKAAAEVRPAIVYLTETFTAYVGDGTGLYYNNGQPLTLNATCTGFGVNPQGYVATAGHCVDTTSPDGIRADFIQMVAQDIAAKTPGVTVQDAMTYGMANWTVEGQAKGSPIDAQYSAVIGSGTGSGAKGEVVPARLVDFRPPSQGDVALLKIESSDLPTVQLGSDADTAIGTPVLSIGYPAAADAVTDTTLEPSNKDGQISTKRTMGSVPYYETSASLSPGMSGGPTVDMDGDVLGINSAHLPNDQAFNFIAPASGLTELLARNGVQNRLGPNDALYRDALANYWAGRYTDAIAGFERLLLVDPGHGQAQQFKTEAAKAKERFGDTPVAPPAEQGGTGFLGLAPWMFWTIVGGAAALLVGGIALLVVLLRRRKGRGEAAVADIPAPRDPRFDDPTNRAPQAPRMPQAPWGSTPVQPVQPPQGPAWQQPRPAAPAGLADGPTAVVTPADIMASQRPAPAGPFLSPGAAPTASQPPTAPPAPSAPPVNGSGEEAAAPTAVVSIPKAGSCPNCGSTVTPGAVFCATCGTRQS